MQKKIEFKITNQTVFINFLKKLKNVNKNVVIEFNKNTISAKTHNPEKTFFKYAYIEYTAISDVKEIDVDSMIKVGVLSLDKILLFFKQFNEKKDVHFTLNYYENEDGLFGSGFIFKSDNLSFNMKCADMALFIYINNESIKDIFNKENNTYNFNIQNSELKKIISLCNIDSDDEDVDMYLLKDKLQFNSKSFNYNFENKINITDGSENLKLKNIIKKNFLSLMDDGDDYNAYVINDFKLILINEFENTFSAIGFKS